MAVKLTPLEKLDFALEEILQDYAQDVTQDMFEVIAEAGKKGQQALKRSSPRSSSAPIGRKHYADNWKVQKYEARLSIREILYNEAPTYRVAHLLENGYRLVNGKQAAPKEHIKPVNDMLAKFVGDAMMARVRQ